MKKITNEFLEESYYYYVLPCGLKVFIYPRPKTTIKKASLSVGYGAINRDYIINGKKESSPSGIAHFLEHLLFVGPKYDDVSNVFEEKGDFVNAYTYYQETNYFFQTNDNLEEDLEVLLDFTLNATFTEENVENERNVIIEEISGEDDNPRIVHRRDFYNNLFCENYYKVPLGGLVEDVKNIEYNMLKSIHDTFYIPDNMSLFIGGDVNPDEIISKLNNLDVLKKFNGVTKSFTYIYQEEKAIPNKKHFERINNVNCNIATIGYKVDLSLYTPIEILSIAKHVSVLLDYCFGASGKYYYQLVDEKIVNSSFSYDYDLTKHYGFISLNCTIDDYNTFFNRIKDIFNNLRIIDIEMSYIEHLKKTYITNYIGRFEYVESVIDGMIDENIDGTDIFDPYEAIISINQEGLLKALSLFNENALTTVVTKRLE